MYMVQEDQKLMSMAVLDNRLKRKAQESGEVFKCVKRSNTASSGNSQLKRLVDLLQSFRVDGKPRHMLQVQLHKGMIGSVMHGIFKNDSEAAQKVAMQMYNLPSSNQYYAAIAPRRIGKTKAVAMFVAAYAIACPGTVIAIFSTGQRASELLLDEVKSFVEQVVDGGFKIIECNKERMVLQCGKLLTKISRYPGRADTYLLFSDIILLFYSLTVSSSPYNVLTINVKCSLTM